RFGIVAERVVEADLLGEFGGIFLGQQAVQRNVAEVGIGQVTIAVAESQLGRLHQQVDIGGTVFLQGGHIEVFQDVEHHQVGKALAVGRMLVTGVPAVGG